MVVSNVKVYGLESAVRGSKFPMATKTEELNGDIVPTTYKLATCERGSGHDQFMYYCAV